MDFLRIVLNVIIFLFQTTPEIDTELDPVETYNFFLIFLGILLIIIILAYILLNSRQE